MESSPDLSPASWAPLSAGSIAGNGQDAVVTDSDPAPMGTRFYRVRLLP